MRMEVGHHRGRETKMETERQGVKMAAQTQSQRDASKGEGKKEEGGR